MTTGERVRRPAVAGLFYPGETEELRAAVDAAMAGAMGPEPAGDRPSKAVIAPHAGYVYSGPVAASAYAQLAPGRGAIKRVVVIGPAHRVPLTAVAASSADAWVTPFGPVEVDTRSARRAAVAARGAWSMTKPTATSTASRSTFPFSRPCWATSPSLPLVVGAVEAGEVADVLAQVWGGRETAIVVSSDLSHYHDHGAATALDRATAEAIVACRPQDVGPGRACGVYALRGLLVAARRRQLDVRLLDLRTSGDTAGGRDRVVGYGAFAIGGDGQDDSDLVAILTDADADRLLDLAEASIRAGLSGQDPPAPDPTQLPAALLAPGGVFVTLEVAGALNGCIGTIEPVEPLASAVVRLARSAAFGDPRLPALSAADWADLRIKISLLSPLVAIAAGCEAEVADRLRAGVDGLVLAAGQHRATFLPTMWSRPAPTSRLRPPPDAQGRHPVGHLAGGDAGVDVHDRGVEPSRVRPFFEPIDR